VLAVAGRVSHASADHLRAALEVAIAREPGGLVLDLSGMDYLSSAGLLAIESASAQLARTGATLVLCDVSEAVRVTLDLAGLDLGRLIAPSREDATRRILRLP
jgi:anti-anti-sigma factor